MQFNNKFNLISVAVSLASVLLFPISLMAATEINIGENNQVNTGKIIGGNCLQGNGKLSKKTAIVEDFKDIVVDGVFAVNVVCGKKTEVTVTADDNLHSLISTVVKNGQLHLSTSGSYCTSNTFVIDITLNKLASITADGSSDLTVECNLAANAPLNIALRGTSSMNISGKAGTVSVSLQDSTELNGFQLIAENVTVKASDAATANLYASQKIVGEGSDASTINYRGRPQIVKVKTTDASECSPED